MLFENQDSSLKLDIVGYELPEGVGDPQSDDRNWLALRAAWNDGGEIVKDSNSCLLTYELQEMAAGLKVLNAGIRDEYRSEFTEPYFSLSARADGDAFAFSVSFYLPNVMYGDDTAEIDCRLDKARMRALLDELSALCEKFPDR